VVETGRLIGCVVPIEGEDGRVLGAGTEVDGAGGTRSAIGVVRLGDGKDGGWAEIARVDAAEGVRCNDGAVDPAGRLWVGTMSLRDEVGRGELFRLDRVGGGAVVTRVLEGVSISNGIGWSPDGRRMYYVDSPTRRVDVFEFDVVTGGVSGRRTLWEVPEEFGGAVPDGLCVDDAGRVWVALWDGWAVACVDGAGMLLGVVRVPAPRVTSCCFGGQDGGTLYVTTASVGLSGAERVRWPASGCVLSCRPEGLGEGARGSAARRVQV
jgi:sugar lactone lactonase YvrE